MPHSDQNPTQEITLNDIYKRLGQVEGICNENAVETAQLKIIVQERCAVHARQIENVVAVVEGHGTRIGTVERTIQGATDFAKGSFLTGKVFWFAIVWILITGIPAAVYAYEIMKGKTMQNQPAVVQPQTPTPGVNP